VLGSAHYWKLRRWAGCDMQPIAGNIWEISRRTNINVRSAAGPLRKLACCRFPVSFHLVCVFSPSPLRSPFSVT
jgi:hypothetical protein